jgi:hypothetical protein
VAPTGGTVFVDEIGELPAETGVPAEGENEELLKQVQLDECCFAMPRRARRRDV